MIKDRPTTRIRSKTTLFCFYLLLFSYPILSLLWRRSYPVFTVEVSWLFLVAIGLSIFFGLITTKLRPPISYFLTGTLILVTAMIQFNLLLEGLAIGVGVIALVMFILKQRFLSFCLPVLVALIFGAYLDSRAEPLIDRSAKNITPVATELAPVIHILLDGFIGIGGLPPYPASDLIRQEILSFFEANEFQLYSHAYSRYDRTGDSMYSLMNYRNDGASIFILEKIGRQDHVMKENAVFTTLEELGYRLNIYQTGHLDMCQSNPDNLDRCWQYDHPNINSVISSSDAKFKSHALVLVLLNQSKLLANIQDKLGYNPTNLGNLAIANHDPQVFEVLTQDIQAKGRGNYFYAHALLPHGPYAYQADCSVNYEAPGQLRIASQRIEVEWHERIYEVRNGFYFSQTECALRSVQSLLDSMKRTGLYDRAIIILHGDHGSHIARQHSHVSNLATFTKQDYRAIYSTLFAVKYPGSEFIVDERALSISYLLEEFMRALPSYATSADSYERFNPSGNADPDKVDSYVYVRGEFPMHREDIDIFTD